LKRTAKFLNKKKKKKEKKKEKKKKKKESVSRVLKREVCRSTT
jgi:hypothetical protein